MKSIQSWSGTKLDYETTDFLHLSKARVLVGNDVPEFSCGSGVFCRAELLLK
jgi:hypothetical protein